MNAFIKYLLILLFYPPLVLSQATVNVYAWGGEIPFALIQKFERETNIKVNYSAFESNEILYAKLKANSDYDVILPSSYLLKKLIDNDKLLKLRLEKIPNLKNINPDFLTPHYDPKNQYSLPFSWGATGIFTHSQFVKPPPHWRNLWDDRFKKMLLLIDDPREVFAIALLSLGYSPNDSNLLHIKEAYEQLIKLKKNIKLITANNIQSLIIDEDLLIGMAWNSDLMKIKPENKHIQLDYPEEGFALWVDCLAILKNAPHKKAAHQFINFLFENNNAIQAQNIEKVPSTNLMANHLLNKQTSNKSQLLIKKGILLSALPPKATKVMVEYWQTFKMNF